MPCSFMIASHCATSSKPEAVDVRLTNRVPWFEATFIIETLISDASFCFAASPKRPSCKVSRNSLAVMTHGTERLNPMVAGTDS